MDSFSRQIVDNTHDLNNGQRRAISVRVNGEEHAAVSDQGDAYIYFPLDGQMMNISELAFKLIIGDGFSTATGDDTNPRTNWEYGDNLYPTYQDWLARYPVGSRIDVDGMAGCQCPVAGTMILMADYRYKPVEDIKVGDLIYGDKFVTRNKRQLSKIIEVNTNLGFFRVTPNHKFISYDHNEIKAKDLKIGQTLAFDNEFRYDKTFELSKSELRLLGFWLGDGHTTKRNGVVNQIGITVGTNKKKQYIESLGIEGRWERHSNKKAYRFFISARKNPILFNVIRLLNGKELPQWFSPSQYKYIVEGYFEADGWTDKNRNRYTFSSTSKKLLIGIQYALLTLGIESKISRPIKRKNTNLCDHPKPIYYLVTKKEKFTGVRVTGVREVEDDNIYIFDVTGDHLYLGDNVLHHNCVDYAAAFWAAKVGAWCVTSQNPSFQKWTASSMWAYPPARQANLFDGRFIEIPDWKDIQAGDWIIWGTYDPTYTGVGHVAMATAKPINLEGASTVAVLQQNKLGNSLTGSPVDTGNLLREGGAYGDFLGAFRYNDPTWLASIPEN